MRKEYDFSRGERGKFYSKNAEMNVPVYLDAETLTFVEEIAIRNNTDIDTVVNELLKKEMGIVKYAVPIE